MLVKKVLAECLVKLGETDFTEETEYTDAQSALLDELLHALNFAYRDAVTEYIPLFKEEEVDVKKGVIFTGELSEKIIYPVLLVAEGCKRRVRIYPDGLVADFDGKAVLRYAYLPAELTLASEIADMRLTPAVLADGTLAEYYFANKLFDLAQSHDNDFRSALSLLRYKGRDMRLKVGRWRA